MAIKEITERFKKDRRQYIYTAHAPERRSGKDRRVNNNNK